MRYSRELLVPIVKDCTSVAQVLRMLGLKQAGGTHHYVSKKLKELNIDISHFLGQSANRGQNHKGGPQTLEWTKILVLRTSGKRQRAFILRRALIESGATYECNECGLSEWRGKEITLHADHKNNNWLDDRKENLRFLCPNCHSQTPKYCGSKGYTELTSRAKGLREFRKNKRSSGGIGIRAGLRNQS